MKYTLSTEKENQHLLSIKFQFNVELTSNFTEVQLPSWRPGRYELGNFAKNIKEFKVTGGSGEVLNFYKITKDRWHIDHEGEIEVIIDYTYYAIDFNAGSTYLGKDVLYVNPVNCFLYVDDYINKECKVTIPVASGQQIASGETIEEGLLTTQTFHELVDNPFIVSSRLQYKTYTVKGVLFYVWFYGECKPQWDRLIEDFKKFTQFQIAQFGSFPVEEYHFINIIHPFKAYHGVEHLKSTIITLGPSYEVFDSLYSELLGISSHELYHTWNIKTIRAKEMKPYNYAKENYSRLGYVAEGVTTYMGDLTLWESGVFTKEDYIKEFNQYLKRHFSNDGRLNLSVADSSYDTWLDGYVMGIPGRKSSIYIEGALISFVLDALIRGNSDNKLNLHHVMKNMYEKYGAESDGYTEKNYLDEIQEAIGKDISSFYNKHINGVHDMELALSSALPIFGFELKKKNSNIRSENYGVICSASGKASKVIHVREGSSAMVSGLTRGDEIVCVNGIMLEGNLDKWLGYFNKDDIKLLVQSNNKLRKVILNGPNENQFYTYSIDDGSHNK